MTRRHPGAGHEGGGGGQSQGTGAGDDQHRYGREQTGLQGVAAQQPAEQGDQSQAHHHRHEHPADAIHQLLDGRLGGLGVFHQADDAGQHRLATQGGDLDLQIALAVDGAPHHLVTGALGDRAAFAGEQGFVHLAFALQDAAVGGDALARAQLQAVAQAQAIQGDLFFLAGRIQAPGAFRAQGFQGAQGRAGAALGAGLQVFAQAHQGDDHGRRLEIEMGAVLDQPEIEAQAIGGAGAQGDQHIHVAAAGAQGMPGTAIEARADDELHRRRQQELQPGGRHQVPAEGRQQHGQDQRCGQQQRQGQFEMLPGHPLPRRG